MKTTFDQMSSADQAELIEAMIGYAAALTKERDELTRQIDRVNAIIMDMQARSAIIMDMQARSAIIMDMQARSAIIMDMQARYGQAIGKHTQEIGPYTGKTVFDKDRLKTENVLLRAAIKDIPLDDIDALTHRVMQYEDAFGEHWRKIAERTTAWLEDIEQFKEENDL